MTELKESAPSVHDLAPRLEALDDQRLAAMPDDQMVSIMVQRRYFADLKLKEQWKKKEQPKKRKLRFLRAH